MTGIFKSPLFRDMTHDEILTLLEGLHHKKTYKTGEIIALQGDRYNALLIVDSGIVRGEMTNSAGDRVVIEEIAAPRTIAPAIVYASDNLLPVDVIAVTNVEIISIKVRDFTRILQTDARVLHNFIRSISDRSKFLSDRVRLLRFGTIKSKLAGYLLEQMQQRKSSEFSISHTQQELADMFGVTRPALSRAIGQLAQDGAIESDKSVYKIIDTKFLIDLESV